MLTFVMTVLLVMAMLDRWRNLPAIRPFRRVLVDTPAAWLESLTRKHLIFVGLMLVVLITGGQMLAALGPLDMSLIFLWDVSAFIDVAVATATLAASARINGGWRMLRPAFGRPRGRRRTARARRRAAARKPGNDDEGQTDGRRAA